MSTISIWNGSSSFTTGSTPFGFYDSDTQFQVDSDRVATFVTRRLGYPITNIELQPINIYAAFEEAVTTYGNELYAYKIRDNYLSLEGLSTGSYFNNAQVTPNMANFIKLSQQYASEAGSGGNVTYYSGSISLTASLQDYDLSTWAINNGISGGIEIKKIFYEASPAVSRFYDPYVGLGSTNTSNGLGLGAYGPGINFLLMPVSYDLQILQQIELNDLTRRSQFSFELINNKLRIFPVPSGELNQLWFQYIKLDDRLDNSISQTPTRINNVGNVPFTNPTYSAINSIGRQWIFEYTLSLSKEILGYVRGKYSTIPIPNSEITLNQQDLLGDAKAEKDALVLRLREFFDQTSRQSLLERRSAENLALKNELSQVPLTIFVG